MTRPVWLAVDGGNTKTEALVVAQSGQVLGQGRAGTGDIYAPAGEAAATRQVALAVDQALDQAGRGWPTVQGVALRLAGVDWPEDEHLWKSWLESKKSGVPCSVLNDGFALLRCADADGIGIGVTAGTFAAVAARGHGGDVWSVGGWFTQNHGACGIGAAGYRAAVRAELGTGPATSLGARLMSAHQLSGLDDLVHRVSRRQPRFPVTGFADFAPLVTAAAAEGDSVASEIVVHECRRLSEYVSAAAQRVGLTGRFDVVLGGSVLSHPGSPVAAGLIQSLGQLIPAARVVRPQLRPVSGAALDALAEAGVTITSHLRTETASSSR